MGTRTRSWLIGLVAVFAVLPFAGTAAAADCAFEDVNDNGVFDVGDAIVPDASWLGGSPFVTNHPFVVPVGCEKTLVTVPAPLQGVRVTATKITFLGRFQSFPPGGRGLVLIADPSAVPAAGLGNGDLTVGNGVDPVLIQAGGFNNLPATTIAVAQKSVALIGTGTCSVTRAELRGNSPIQNTRVGVLCTGDLTFANSTVVGSTVNIQSLQGAINAAGTGGGGGFSLADLCDNAATNLAGNGNDNDVIDAGDLPCTLNLSGFTTVDFADATALAQACQIDPFVGFNSFHAFNDPILMIAGAGAGKNVDVRGASIVGRYRVTLAAEDGDLLTQGAIIDHGEQLGLIPPGGARIWLFADPTTVVRLPVGREDFLGPSAGTTDITNTCYRSPNPVSVGRDGGGTISLLSVPAPPPCKQNPPDFVPVLNGVF